MANGFLTSSPASRHGTSSGTYSAGWAMVQKFTVPGSGAKNINEIGVWGHNSGDAFKMAIFTDDAVNDCPESMVTNSESAELTWTEDASIEKIFHTYITKPEVTGGVAYWICIFFESNEVLDYETGSGIDALNTTGTYDTWPSGDDWHSHTDRPLRDLGIYAVYEDAAAAAWSPIPLIVKLFRRLRG